MSFTFVFCPLRNAAWGNRSAHFSHWVSSLCLTIFCSFTSSTSTHKLVPFNARYYYGNVCFLDQKVILFFSMFFFLNIGESKAAPITMFYKNHGKAKQPLTKPKGWQPMTYALANACFFLIWCLSHSLNSPIGLYKGVKYSCIYSQTDTDTHVSLFDAPFNLTFPIGSSDVLLVVSEPPQLMCVYFGDMPFVVGDHLLSIVPNGLIALRLFSLYP